MITRRRLLIASVAAATLTAIGWHKTDIKASAHKLVVHLIKDKLHYLHHDEEGLYAFAEDFLRRKDVSLTTKAGLAGIAIRWSHYLGFRKHIVDSHSIQNLQQELMSAYLLSSDFFQNGANENLPINYLGKNNLYPACRHPFARYQNS